MNKKSAKIAYGDFQTPIEFAIEVCTLLVSKNINPSLIIEPTCGIGNFVEVSLALFPDSKNIYGYEVNKKYLDEAQNRIKHDLRVKWQCKDFFFVNWEKELAEEKEPLLILGNLPWVTNSTQGSLSMENLPCKSNFLKFKGLDAITGKANFDISEWMLITLIEATKAVTCDIAVLIKTSVARKLLQYFSKNKIQISSASIYNIDAKRIFNASVSACLFHVKIDGNKRLVNSCDVYKDLCSPTKEKLYISYGEICSVKQCKSNVFLCSPQKWRSGVKHDAAKIMELSNIDGNFINGLGDRVTIDTDYVFPLMKGSDVANNRFSNKYIIVPQRSIGENTDIIRERAKNTWSYLTKHSLVLDNRKSSIYKNNPRFSIFGVGDYAFKNWKIAICGLYKKLLFNIVGPINGKPCIFDDTVYFVSFDTQEEALHVYSVLTSKEASMFFINHIFWDDKRPIKTAILNKFNWNLSGFKN